MANTPLELYEQAYRLHYHDKRISDAIKTYEAIIRDFPDSNECGYAVIQLQKVKANEIARALKKGPANMYPLLIVAFMSSFIALVVALVGVLLLFQQLRLEHHRTTLAMAALGKMYCGKEDNALKILEELKGINRNDPLPIELSSDIYRKHNQKKKGSPPVPSQAAAAVADSQINDYSESAEPENEPAQEKTTPATAPEKPRPKAKKAAPVRQAPKKKKGILLVDPDSLTYF
ncbi:MAG: hypothetical protein JW768_14210 [Chitinispirillaceae bacterium]|nr:hypothetical protein [Chitinispirillaceae bacterium]